MLPSLFQEATCSDLVFSRVLCFFEKARAIIPVFKSSKLICHSNCSHAFNEWPLFYYKRAATATHSFKFTVFFWNRRSCSKEISYLSTVILPWLQACINWKIAGYLTTSIAAIRFFYLSLFHGTIWNDPICQGHCVYFTTLQTSIIVCWFEKIWRVLCLFEENHCNIAL